MELLGARTQAGGRGRRGVNLALAAILVGAASGCAVLGLFGLGDEPLAFSHERHKKEGLDCTDCHVADADGRRLGYPVLAQCALCHADIDAEKAPERRVDTLFVDGRFNAAGVTWLSDEVRFSHVTHLQAGAECEHCHRGMAQSERVDDGDAIVMQTCVNCHVAVGAEQECATCHTVIHRGTPPANHEQLWRQLHGQVVRGGLPGAANDCTMCHSEQTCTQCHQDEKPASHNVFWRERTHGFAAAMDRESCATCHKEDSCSSCHADTKPLSHVGMWGNPLNTHCFTCHLPLKAESCSVCHKGTPSHLEAPPKPDVPPHSPAMDCRSCHGVTAPLPHVDNGDDCNACHQ
jgi:hypothetical protein